VLRLDRGKTRTNVIALLNNQTMGNSLSLAAGQFVANHFWKRQLFSVYCN